MTIIKWSEDLRIGIESIDGQHRYLINLINELHLAVEYRQGNEIILPIIDKLQRYADTHFGEEEALFDRYEFPGMVDHVEEHDEFLARVQELKTRYRESADELTINVRNFLLSWFYNHIKLNDMEYKAYLEQKKVLTPSGR